MINVDKSCQQKAQRWHDRSSVIANTVGIVTCDILTRGNSIVTRGHNLQLSKETCPSRIRRDYFSQRILKWIAKRHCQCCIGQQTKTSILLPRESDSGMAHSEQKLNQTLSRIRAIESGKKELDLSSSFSTRPTSTGTH